MFESNHAKLIAACYPAITPATTLNSSHPDSNFLGKLTFYASTRPKKLPVLLQTLLVNAIKEVKGGDKGLKTFAITLEIVRGIVNECRTELECCGEDVLKICEIGLRLNEVELVARATGIFHAVATFANGPFLGLDDGFASEYMKCLSSLSTKAQGRGTDAEVKRIALLALDAACQSENLYAVAADYAAQAELLIPTLLDNCVTVSVDELIEYNGKEPVRLGPVSDRKSPVIVTSSDSVPYTTLATLALKSLNTLFRLAHAPQLTILLRSTTQWIDSYSAGLLWCGDEVEQDFVEWLTSSILGFVGDAYRSEVVHYFSEQILLTNSEGTPTASVDKSYKLVEILSRLLRSPLELVGMNTGTILGHLTSVLVRRSAKGLEDDYTMSITTTIISLNHKAPDQVNDIVGDIIEVIKSVRGGGGVTNDMTGASKVRAVKILLKTIKEVLKDKRKGEGRPRVTSRGTLTLNGSNGKAAAATKRYRVTPETIQDSIFLLNDPSTTLRIEYARLLLSYLTEEMTLQANLEDNSDSTTFFAAFYSAVYELAFNTSLTNSSPKSSALSRAASRRSFASSKSARRGSTASLRSLTSSDTATALDYALLAELMPAGLGQLNMISLLKGFPVLVALERNGLELERTEDEDVVGGDNIDERRKAISEIVANGLIAVGLTWKCAEVEKIGQEMIRALAPSVLPEITRSKNEFTTHAVINQPMTPLDSIKVAEALANSEEVQRVTGMSYDDLVRRLGAEYNFERNRPIIPLIYRPIASQSITNLSLRSPYSNHSPSSPKSQRYPSQTTSLADLQNSLAHSNGRSSLASASASFTSRRSGASGQSSRLGLGFGERGDEMRGDRRSKSMGAKRVLEGLNKRLSVAL